MADLKFDIVAIDRASQTFVKAADQIERLSRRMDELDRKNAELRATANTKAAEAGLDNVERKRRALDGSTATVKVKTDKSLTDTINGLARLGGSLQTLTMPASLLAAAPQVASLGAAAVSASGSLLLMPAAAAAAGVAAGTLAVGLAHVADALGPTGTAAQVKKVNEAMAKLPPNARAAVKELRELGPAWSDVRMEVQQQLWDGAAKTIERLGARYLPIAKVGLAGVADEFNNGATQLAKWADSDAVMLDLAGIIGRVKVALHEAAPAGTNLAAALTDMSVVGSTRLPALSGGLADATGRFREFIAEARRSGQLGEWIDTGIAKIEQVGHVASNTGGILLSVFDAADQSGADFLGTVEELTGKVNDFFNSADGEQALLDFFTNIGESVDNLQPGLDALGRALVTSIGTVGPLLPQAAEGVSKVAQAAAPLVTSAAELARIVAGPLISGLSAVAPILTPIAGGLLATTVASRGLSAAQGFVGGLSSRMGDAALKAGLMTEKLTGSADAGTRVASAGDRVSGALGKVGSALPLVGVALVGVGFAYDELRDKSDQFAANAISGSMSMQDAINAERNSIEKRNFWIGDTTPKLDNETEARRNLYTELNKQLAVMSPLEKANFYVTTAQERLNVAVAQFGPTSQQARDAQAALTFAVDGQTFAQQRNADQLQSTTDKLIANTNAVAGAANADLGLEQAVLRTRQAREQATEVLRTHTTSSLEGQQAVLALQQANLSEAASAQRKAEADAVAKGASDSAAQGARAYADRLIELASQATGPTRTALLGYVANLDSTKSGANDSALASRGLTDDISKIPGYHATTFATPGLDAARDGIKGITQEILKIQGKDIPIFVSPLGKGGVASAPRLADGGILPGYTPGRDVHMFMSATGGALALSGGEAVMRPEVPRALGAGWVHGVNAAARSGGVSGVRRAMGFAAGGILPQRNGSSPVNLNVEWDRQGVQLGYPMPAGGSIGGAGVQRWAPLVLQALQMMGQPASYLGIVLRRMNQESGGNPTIVNNWDINAKRGTPSGGLMQTIEPTYRAYADPRRNLGMFDPLSNILASMRYALARYGSLPAAYNKAGGYANGGIIDRPTFGLVGEAGPEAIIPLSRPNRAAEVMKQAGLAGGARSVTITGPIHIHKTADVDEVLDRVNYLMAGG